MDDPNRRNHDQPIPTSHRTKHPSPRCRARRRRPAGKTPGAASKPPKRGHHRGRHGTRCTQRSASGELSDFPCCLNPSDTAGHRSTSIQTTLQLIVLVVLLALCFNRYLNAQASYLHNSVHCSTFPCSSGYPLTSTALAKYYCHLKLCAKSTIRITKSQLHQNLTRRTSWFYDLWLTDTTSPNLGSTLFDLFDVQTNLTLKVLLPLNFRSTIKCYREYI